jgi:glycosyltransferase involved in cell wall biosynthesis/CDP-glycerol glycerophosphotransferase (TagB/SpsB family)
MSARKYSVVTPVFRVEKYLEQYLVSLSRQTLDFKSHIELILVDDGSDDGSSGICQAWSARYPGNIIYLRKENGGLSSARNAGLQYATGEWVTFCDPDDFVNATYFEQVDKALARFGGEPISLVACNVIFYHESGNRFSNDHPLSYKFRQGVRVSDLDASPKPEPQLQAASSFLKRQAIKDAGLVFRDGLPVFEDADLIARYLLAQQNRTILFVPEAHYYYRKRSDGSSQLDRSLRDPRRYSALLEHGYLDLLQYALRAEGRIPDWIQRTITYDLTWQINMFVNNQKNSALIQPEARPHYYTLLKRIFSHIDTAIINDFELAGLNNLHKVGILGFCKGESTHASSAYIFSVDRQRMLIGLRLVFSGPCPEVAFFKSGKPIQPRYRKIRIHRFVDQAFAHEAIFWLPWTSAGQLSLRIGAAALPVRLPSGAVAASVMLPELSLVYPQLDVAGLPDSVKAYRQLAASPAYANKYRKAWLLMDRDTQADDNAEHLYRYIMRQGMPVNAWFLLRKDSHDWPRLAAEGFRLIEYGSREHGLALLNAEHLVSSHAGEFVQDVLPAAYFGDRLRFQFTFLQHGVTQSDMSEWLNNLDIAHFICASRQEADSITSDFNAYKFCEREVAVTGLPRHDRLNAPGPAAAERRMLFMPTWRQGLAGQPVPMSSRYDYNPDFVHSEFFRAWRELLESPELVRLSDESGYKRILFLHPLLESYAKDFNMPGVEVLSSRDVGSIQELFFRATMLITDYSSVAFELAYLMKPVIYYQFDEAFMFGGGHSVRRGYFDFRRDGFGPVCTDIPAVLGEIARNVASNGTPDAVYAQRMRDFFPYRDGKCCERVFKCIQRGQTE